MVGWGLCALLQGADAQWLVRLHVWDDMGARPCVWRRCMCCVASGGLCVAGAQVCVVPSWCFVCPCGHERASKGTSLLGPRQCVALGEVVSGVRACVYMYVRTHTRTLHPRHGDTPPGSCYSIRLMQVMSGGGVTSGLQVASPGRKAPVTFLTLSARGQPQGPPWCP